MLSGFIIRLSLLCYINDSLLGYHYVIKVITGLKDFSDSYASLKLNIKGKHGQSGDEEIGR